jgi:hypothetical protein
LSAAPALALIAGTALAQDATYTENFTSSAAGWDGGGSTVTWISSGGFDGIDDGYIEVSTEFPAQLGARAAGANESIAFIGDYVAAGITGVSFALNELAVDDGIEIHVTVGSAFGNVWTYNIGLDAQANTWTEFTVDFTDASNWTQIIGSGTFEQAIANTDRLLFRHDFAPFSRFPDPIAGSIGIDRITLIPAPGVAPVLAIGGIVAVRRKR